MARRCAQHRRAERRGTFLKESRNEMISFGRPLAPCAELSGPRPTKSPTFTTSRPLSQFTVASSSAASPGNPRRQRKVANSDGQTGIMPAMQCAKKAPHQTPSTEGRRVRKVNVKDRTAMSCTRTKHAIPAPPGHWAACRKGVWTNTYTFTGRQHSHGNTSRATTRA
jgi:hypothetical protein